MTNLALAWALAVSTASATTALSPNANTSRVSTEPSCIDVTSAKAIAPAMNAAPNQIARYLL